MHATRKKYASLYRAGTQRRKTQIDYNYTSSYSPTHGEFENLCFIFVAPMVCVLRTFVYNVVDLNIIVVVFFFNKTAFIRLCASDCRAKTIVWLICQSVVNIVSQIPTV